MRGEGRGRKGWEGRGGGREGRDFQRAPPRGGEGEGQGKEGMVQHTQLSARSAANAIP
jgi:hypothetical protein